MQIEIKINDSYTEPKVVILTAAMTEEVNSIMHKLSDNNSRTAPSAIRNRGTVAVPSVCPHLQFGNHQSEKG